MANTARVAMVAAPYFIFVSANATFLALAAALALQLTFSCRFFALGKAAQRVGAG